MFERRYQDEEPGTDRAKMATRSGLSIEGRVGDRRPGFYHPGSDIEDANFSIKDLDWSQEDTRTKSQDL